MEREVRSLPVVALRGMTVLPEMVIHFDVSRQASIEAMECSYAGRRSEDFSDRTEGF